ncbi:hypothetical protein vBKpnPKlyazma_orf077 [Klebsiella phage vB_KpnP_Klyazma]|nr:hypothetical protein vBKpnPKlyazma_orf077 [Klebsiella phage vB_KpnP_Klyazma]
MSDVIHNAAVFDLAKATSGMVELVCDKTDLPHDVKYNIQQSVYEAVITAYRLGFRMGEKDEHH